MARPVCIECGHSYVLAAETNPAVMATARGRQASFSMRWLVCSLANGLLASGTLVYACLAVAGLAGGLALVFAAAGLCGAVFKIAVLR
jgi:hypothetical protein